MQRVRGPLVAVAAGVALIATSFFPLWATYRISGLDLVAPQTVHQNAWTAYGITMQLALVLAFGVVVLAAIHAAPRGLGSQRTATAQLASSAVSTLLLVWQVVAGPIGAGGSSGYGVERGMLVFTGAALGAAMTYGSYLTRRKPPAGARFGDDVRTARRPTSLGE